MECSIQSYSLSYTLSKSGFLDRGEDSLFLHADCVQGIYVYKLHQYTVKQTWLPFHIKNITS